MSIILCRKKNEKKNVYLIVDQNCAGRSTGFMLGNYCFGITFFRKFVRNGGKGRKVWWLIIYINLIYLFFHIFTPPKPIKIFFTNFILHQKLLHPNLITANLKTIKNYWHQSQ